MCGCKHVFMLVTQTHTRLGPQRHKMKENTLFLQSFADLGMYGVQEEEALASHSRLVSYTMNEESFFS